MLSCATYRGEGIVTRKELYSEGHAKSTAPIKKHAKRGMRIGAETGLGVGGFLAAFMAGLSSPGNRKALPGIVLADIAGGTLIFGSIGTIIGSTVGLLQYLITPAEKAMWQYEVKTVNSKETFTVNQKIANIPLNAHVKVMEQNSRLFIQRN
ncbi:MAG: hypothetical protein P1U32_01505 [Legionellaceae bacterium]|nr:hypothetical protein [Legionellaceae bacterium]